MKTETQPTGNLITVIPYLPFSDDFIGEPIAISKLCYHHNGQCDHPVNDETIPFFIENLSKYGASIFPEHPEHGCYAVEGQLLIAHGEYRAFEIYYKGRLIYQSGTKNL